MALTVVFAGGSVAAANTLDLFTFGSYGTINGALFQEGHAQPAGSGYIDPFIRIQAPNGNQHYESGFNTNFDGTPLDDKDAGNTNFNHAFQVKDLQSATLGGVDYFQFALDFDEPIAGNKSKISLQDFRLFLSGSPTNSTLATLGTKIFDLDQGPDGNSRIDGEADIAPGSGKFNMIANIPKSLFTGSVDQYVYLYTYFGEQGTGDKGYGCEGGFEEWTYNQATFSPPVPGSGVPLPAAASGGLLLLVGLGTVRGRRGYKTSA
jgi:hypothetical protein